MALTTLTICVMMAIGLILLGVSLFFIAIVQAGSEYPRKSYPWLAVAGGVTLLLGIFIGYIAWMGIDESAYAENARAEANLRVIR